MIGELLAEADKPAIVRAFHYGVPVNMRKRLGAGGR